MRKQALVLDGRTLSSLAVARSLGSEGYSIHCGESFKLNITSFSKHVEERVSYPSAEEEPEEFVEAILALVQEHQYDVVIPTRDATTELLSANQEALDEHTNTYLAQPEIMEQFMDKGETIKTAEQAGIPTPETYFPERTDLDQIKTELSYPALVRPRRSAGSRGITRVESPTELERAYQEVRSEYGEPMIQEYIEKTGYTTACILLNGDQHEVASFSYERVKEYPPSGGPTVVGVSTDDAEAKQAAKQLLQEGDWKGVAEVEFILDQEGVPRLLEVNPRFWMPVHLAVVSGIDFPSLVANLALGESISGESQYETDIVYRWVLPNEILWSMNQKNVGWISDLSIKSNDSSCFGVLSWRDPIPTLGTFVQSIQFLLDKNKREQVLNR